MNTVPIRQQVKASAALHRESVRHDNEIYWDALVDRALRIEHGKTALTCYLRSAHYPLSLEILDAGVPIIDNLLTKLAEAVGEGGQHLDMETWHCGTTHCVAGWVVTLAGEQGSALSYLLGVGAAAILIYEASTGLEAPDFRTSNEKALEDIKRRARQPFDPLAHEQVR